MSMWTYVNGNILINTYSHPKQNKVFKHFLIHCLKQVEVKDLANIMYIF